MPTDQAPFVRRWRFFARLVRRRIQTVNHGAHCSKIVGMTLGKLPHPAATVAGTGRIPRRIPRISHGQAFLPTLPSYWQRGRCQVGCSGCYCRRKDQQMSTSNGSSSQCLVIGVEIQCLETHTTKRRETMEPWLSGMGLSDVGAAEWILLSQSAAAIGFCSKLSKAPCVIDSSIRLITYCSSTSQISKSSQAVVKVLLPLLQCLDLSL